MVFMSFKQSFFMFAFMVLIGQHFNVVHAAVLNPEDVREVRSFIADVIDPAAIIQDSTEQPQRIAFKRHLRALKLLILSPSSLEESLGLARQGGSSMTSQLGSYLSSFGLYQLRDAILNSPEADAIISRGIDAITDARFNDLNRTINAFAGDFSFDSVGLDKLSLIKVDGGMGKIGNFILEVLKNYHKEQATVDKRFIIATFLRSTMPDDPDEKKLLAVTKASGPFFHKIIQLVGDFVSDATPEGRRLKDTLNEVKRNLLPINSFELDKLIKEVEASSGGRFTISVIKTLGVASIGHALLVNINHRSGQQERAVLKFIKPGVKERAERDVKIIVPIARNLGVLSFFEGTITDIMEELDFKNELRNLKMADEIYNTNDPNDPVGAVKAVKDFPENPKWIAMTLAPGRSFADFGKEPALTAEEKLDREIEYMIRGLALDKLTNRWMLQAFFGRRDGFYHGDLHAGNILINIETKAIKDFLRSKFGAISFDKLNENMFKQVPTNLYRVSLIDFGNAGYLNPNDRLNVLNFFISTIDEIHSWDGFYEAYKNLIGTSLTSAQETKLKKEVKEIFDQNKSQGALLGKLVTFFLEGNYPPLPPVMANFGRSQAMLNNIFNNLQNEAVKTGLVAANFTFSKSILEDLKQLLAEGTFIVFQRTDAFGNKLYLNTGNLAAVTRYGISYGIGWIKDKLGLSKIPLGGACKRTLECQNWTIGGQPGIACCDGTCQEKKKDWFGTYYCPHECRGSFGAKTGTCK